SEERFVANASGSYTVRARTSQRFSGGAAPSRARVRTPSRPPTTLRMLGRRPMRPYRVPRHHAPQPAPLVLHEHLRTRVPARGLCLLAVSNLWAFILLIGPLIFIHELGHLIAAKLVDVKVTRFSIGFGPALLRFRIGE